MFAGEELLKGDEIAQTLTHFLPIDGNHVVVHPVANHLVALACNGLSNLAFVVREYQIHPTAVYIKVVSQVLSSHSRALAVPSGETVAPRTGPAHDVFGLGFLPKGKVYLILFLTHSGQFAAVVNHIGEVSARQDAILMMGIVFHNIKVNAAVAFVGISVFQDFLHQFLLFNDMPRGVRLYRWRQHVQLFHGFMVAVGVVLGYLHRLKLLETSLFLYLVVALIGIVFKVTHVGYIAHIAHLIAQMAQVSEHNVEGNSRTGMPQMRVAVHRRAANIHAYVGCMQRLEELFASRECIINQQFLFHDALFFVVMFFLQS